MEKCKNCGRVIGNLETPHIYRGQIVCASCSTILNHSSQISPVAKTSTPPTQQDMYVTTQGTSKRLKVAQLIAGGVIAIGIVLLVISTQGGKSTEWLSPVGAVIFLLGILAYMGVRGVIWWNHG